MNSDQGISKAESKKFWVMDFYFRNMFGEINCRRVVLVSMGLLADGIPQGGTAFKLGLRFAG